MGVDAGGDAFALAQEMYDAASAQVHVTAESVAVLQRSAEQAARYQARIDEQAKLLGLQGKRIQGAIHALNNDQPQKALQWLHGEWDSADG